MGEPMPGPWGTEMRWASLPDGTRMLIAVKRGLSQDEVDLLAARLWQEMPDE
ncbi:hypothetical protein [Streptomyces sp. SID10815]|uniref:hypothetical protein n=1 Tax=Streptomyces sp. SID10815 TaxID=2706027 RepID=UPI0013C63438|nr:hypothetical protein [Streptomyces sp. SID10815]NEA52382.1 hypothetical protein [Streptomyces sp. SID10815]